MKKVFLIVVMAVVSQHSFSQQALFENNMINFFGIGVVDGESNSYYENVQLNHEGDGIFRLVRAESRSLVTVDFIDVAVNETYHQAVVTLEGYKSNPCVELLDPAIHSSGSNFTIVLAESQLGPEETCIAEVDLYTKAFVLDIKGMGPGFFTLKANGVASGFELTTSN